MYLLRESSSMEKLKPVMRKAECKEPAVGGRNSDTVAQSFSVLVLGQITSLLSELLRSKMIPFWPLHITKLVNTQGLKVVYKT